VALHRYTCQIGAAGAAAAEPLAAGTAETVLQLVAAATRWATITEIGIGFDSVTASNVPATVELMLQSTAGTSAAFTPLPDTPGMPAAITTCLHHFTAEPTTTTCLWSITVPVVGGTFVIQAPLDREIYTMPISTRVGLRITSPSVVNVRGYMRFEE